MVWNQDMASLPVISNEHLVPGLQVPPKTSALSRLRNLVTRMCPSLSVLIRIPDRNGTQLTGTR
jgi:hypothetical protein